MWFIKSTHIHKETEQLGNWKMVSYKDVSAVNMFCGIKFYINDIVISERIGKK